MPSVSTDRTRSGVILVGRDGSRFRLYVGRVLNCHLRQPLRQNAFQRHKTNGTTDIRKLTFSDTAPNLKYRNVFDSGNEHCKMVGHPLKIRDLKRIFFINKKHPQVPASQQKKNNSSRKSRFEKNILQEYR